MSWENTFTPMYARFNRVAAVHGNDDALFWLHRTQAARASGAAHVATGQALSPASPVAVTHAAGALDTPAHRGPGETESHPAGHSPGHTPTDVLPSGA